MAIRIRTTRTQDEYTAAIKSIGHYFGGGWTPEEAEEFVRLLPHERMHAAFDGEKVVGGAGVFPFELTVPGGNQLPCAGVTVVGVLPTHRRQGILGRMMRAQLDDIRKRGEPIAALWASEETIYGRFGYGMAAQDAMVKATRVHAELQPDLPRAGTTRLVGHEEALATFPRIYDRVARRTSGFTTRSREWWELRKLDDRPDSRRGAGELNRLLLEIDGRPVGYALYRIKLQFEDATNTSEVRVIEAIGDSPVAIRELWRALLTIDWTGSIECFTLPADHPLFLLVRRPNQLGWKVFDGLWMRLIDLETALSARSLASDGRVTFEITADPMFPENAGTWTMEPGRARRTSRRADVRLDIQALASAYLGGFTFADLLRAGRVEEVARGGLARADALFHVDRKPWTPEIF